MGKDKGGGIKGNREKLKFKDEGIKDKKGE